MREPERTKVRWPLAVTVTAVGLVVVATPYLLAKFFNEGFGEWRGLTSSTLTNVGTTFLLAALLFVLERRLLARVTDAAAVSASQVVEERTRGLVESNQQMREQLDALQEAVEARSARAESEAASAADHISKDVSFDSVTRALELANDVNGLWHGAVAVPATRAVGGPSVQFDWRYRPEPDSDGRDGYLIPGLDLALIRSSPRVQVRWNPEESASSALHRLREQMVRNDLGAEARELDAEHMFKMFQVAIREAIAGRRHTEGFWIHGGLGELVSADIAITAEGICVQGQGLVVSSREFPERDPFRRMRPTPSDEPARPEFSLPRGVTPDEWQVAVDRAYRVHPPNPALSLLSGSFEYRTEVVTSENTPRNT